MNRSAWSDRQALSEYFKLGNHPMIVKTNKHMLEYADLKPGMSVVEVGCGPGTFAEMALKQKISYLGIDVSPEMLAEARKRIKSRRAEFILAKTEEAKIPDESVDVVVCNLAYHWLDEKDEAAIARMLKTGGRLIFNTVGVKQDESMNELERTYRRSLEKHLKQSIADDETVTLKIVRKLIEPDRLHWLGLVPIDEQDRIARIPLSIKQLFEWQSQRHNCVNILGEIPHKKAIRILGDACKQAGLEISATHIPIAVTYQIMMKVKRDK